MNKIMKNKPALILGLVGFIFLTLWIFEMNRHSKLRGFVEKDRQVTLQKIIDTVEKDLTEVSNNFDLYREFGAKILDSTTWYVDNAAPMINDYGDSIETTTSTLSIVLPYIPVVGPMLGMVTEKIESIISMSLSYTNQFNSYVGLIGETNKTMDEIQELHQNFLKTRNLQTLSRLKDVIDLDFRQKMEKTSSAASQVENAIRAIENFMNESLKMAYLIQKKLSEYERGNQIEMTQKGIEDKDSLLSNLKKQIDLKISGTSRILIKQARVTLDKHISKLEENIKQINFKTEPYKNQIMNYTVKLKEDFKKVSRIIAGIQIIEMLESTNW